MKLKSVWAVGRLFVMAAFATTLISCASSPKSELNISSASFLNPDINNQPSPIVVTVMQLKSAYKFNQATYNELMGNPSKALGNDLIDMSSYEIRPSTKKSINIDLSPTTQYLGVVAAYRKVNEAKWHQSVKVINEKGHKTTLNINLQSEGLYINATQGHSGLF